MKIAWFTVLVCAFSIHVSAEVYKWVDESGITHFTDKKPQTTEKVDFVAIEGKNTNSFKANEALSPDAEKFLRNREEARKQQKVAKRKKMRAKRLAIQKKALKAKTNAAAASSNKVPAGVLIKERIRRAKNNGSNYCPGCGPGWQHR